MLLFEHAQYSMDQARVVLRDVFGHSDFRKGQSQVIEQALSGGDVLALMPTGGGKSLCFQVPSLVRKGVGLVVSPLISLMQDQVEALCEMGLKARFLNSTLTYREVLEVEREFVQGELDFLYLSPERLQNSRTIDLLKRHSLSLIAIDEAHCVSKWGHDFRPDYLKLQLLKKHFPDVPMMALTATADKLTQRDIVEELGMGSAKVYFTSFDRPNIQMLIEKRKAWKDQLMDFLDQFDEYDTGIIYCLSRRKVEEVAAYLCEQGINAYPYHAGMSQKIRAKYQEAFSLDEGVIMVATIAFGMGIDRPDVRFVCHLDMPKSIESYYQEIGRAGRDSLESTSLLLYSDSDATKLINMMRNNDHGIEYAEHLKEQVETMLSLCETMSCRRQVVLDHFDEVSDEYCGNCDRCLGSLDKEDLFDGTELTIMALSEIYEANQSITTNEVIRRVLQRLNQDSTNKDLYKSWRFILRQMRSSGLIKLDADSHFQLKIRQNALAILRDEKKIYFSRSPFVKVKESRASSSKSAMGRAKTKRKKALTKNNVTDQALFEKLRDLRKKIADRKRIAAYKVFHDTALYEMAQNRPSSPQEFLSINGVGKSKLKKYGDLFMELIEMN